MKYLLIILFSLNCLIAFGQQSLPDDSVGRGFTKKSEARNSIVNGLKEGKWVEYKEMRRGIGIVITKDTNASFYDLTIYRFGKPIGIVREYYKGGILKRETPYTEGEKNGVKKNYYAGGKLQSEIVWKNGKEKKTTNYDENGNIVK